MTSLAASGCTTCREGEPEPADVEGEGRGEVMGEKVVHAPEVQSTSNTEAPPPPRAARQPTSPDPENGTFTVEEALAGLAGEGPVQAVIHTDLGQVTCKLYTDRAPKTAANFIGLARGKRPYWDARARAWVRRPFYNGLTFHRIIPEYMIQGGDLYGDGSGGVGYEFADEHWENETHDKAGLLCMANHGPDTNGGQFFILEAPAKELDRHNSYTIFGECSPVDTVKRIARVPQRGRPTNRPLTPIRMTHMVVQRQNGSDRPPEAEADKNRPDPRHPSVDDYTPPGALMPPRRLPRPEDRPVTPP